MALAIRPQALNFECGMSGGGDGGKGSSGSRLQHDDAKAMAKAKKNAALQRTEVPWPLTSGTSLPRTLWVEPIVPGSHVHRSHMQPKASGGGGVEMKIC